MSDRDEFEATAEWCDALLNRLQGAEIMFALEMGNESYCESLCENIEQVVILGIGLGQTMEHCFCLFESIGSFGTPQDYLMKARHEINRLSLSLRQMASITEEPTKDAFELHHDSFPDSASRREIADSWYRKLDGKKQKQLRDAYENMDGVMDHLIDKVKNLRSKRNRENRQP